MTRSQEPGVRDPLVFVAIVQGILIVLLAYALLRPQAPPPPSAAAPPERAREEAPETGSTDGDVVGQRHAPAEAPSATPPPEATEPPPAERAVPSTTVLYGSVTDAQGETIDSGWLTVHPAAETARERLAQVTLRDASRGYAVPGLEPGSYRVRARATGYREREDRIEVVAGTDALRHDVVLEKSWELKVLFLTPAGRPLHERLAELREDHAGLWNVGPIAIATAGPPPPVLPSTTLRNPRFGVGKWVGTHGGFPSARTKLAERYAGYLELEEDRPLHVSAVLRTAVLATEQVSPGQEEVTLTVPFEQVLGSLCTVRLRVVDAATGAPVPEARVELSDSQSGGRGEPVDAEGRVELRFQRPGTLELDVRAKGRVARWYDLDLAPGQEVDLGDVELHPPLELNLRFEGVADEDEVRVSLLGLDPPPHHALQPRSPRWASRKGGTFTARVAPGRYLLRARAEERMAQLEIDTRSLGDEPLAVRLGDAAKLRVVPPAGSEQVGLRILDASGRSHFHRWINWNTAFDVQLLPGDYVAVVSKADGTEERRAVSVPIGGAGLDLR